MKKEQVLSRLKEDCLVAVVRAKNLEQGEKVVDAIIAGGINFIEITMTMDEGNPVEFIAAMAKKYKDNGVYFPSEYWLLAGCMETNPQE